MVVCCLFWLLVVGFLGIALLLLVLVVVMVSLAVFGGGVILLVLVVEVVNPPTSQPTNQPPNQATTQPTIPTNQPVSLLLLRLVSHGRSVVGLLFQKGLLWGPYPPPRPSEA